MSENALRHHPRYLAARLSSDAPALDADAGFCDLVRRGRHVTPDRRSARHGARDTMVSD